MKKIWIDCDPGIDDALMLALAGKYSNQLEIIGISSVAGNQNSDIVTENALELSVLLNMEDVPVYRGARTPLLKEYVDAGEVHGDNGLGGVKLPLTNKQISVQPALYMMINALLNLKENEKLTLVSTGPLTNIALLVQSAPDLLDRIECLVMMGGGLEHGNTTPYAEFNVYSDPEAANIVYHSSLKIVMCGLDITEKCVLNKKHIPALANSSNVKTATLGKMLEFYGNCEFYKDYNAITMHDVTTLVYLMHPEFFEGINVSIDVDCSEEKRGMLKPSNGGKILALTNGNVEAFEQFVLDTLHHL